jgi:hypothetical protein
MKKVSLLLLGMLLMPFLVNSANQNFHPLFYQSTISVNRDTVRGVSFEDFKNSLNKSKVKPSKQFLTTAWNLWKIKDWQKLYGLFRDSSQINYGYPPNYGADSAEVPTMLQKGTLVDRYVSRINADSLGFHDYGDFLGTKDVSFQQRSLPDQWYIYTIYKVGKDIINVKKSIAIPWFDQVGGGIQYHLTKDLKIEQLKKDSSLIEVKPLLFKK